MLRQSYIRQGELLLPVIAYGDAAGLPVEAKTAQYIADTYGRISRLESPKENPYYVGEHPVGTWSDDTELSVAVAKALIRAQGFDIFAQADTHIEAFSETAYIDVNGKVKKIGWGGSTTAAVRQLSEGVLPKFSGTKDGAGNGVLMKMAPLVFWQVATELSRQERYQQYDVLTTMTHDSPVARLTSRVHGDVLEYLMKTTYEKHRFLEFLDEQVKYHEEVTGQRGVMSDLFGYLYGNTDDASILSATDGKGFYAPETLAMAYGAFIEHGGKFENGVYGAVNLGGDADSLGTIVAVMSHFAQKGEQALPDDFEKIVNIGNLRRISNKLTQLALS